MKTNTHIKHTVDVCMTLLLPVLMAAQLIGDAAHEWLGAGMFVLFILHNILNWKWYKALPRGRYSAPRILISAIDLLVFLSMIGFMVSGVMLSRYVFAFRPIQSGSSFARTLHMLATYWGFVFMSLHLGLHWGMVLKAVRKITKKGATKTQVVILRLMAILLSAYGCYAFAARSIGSYMFLKTPFVFLNYDEPLLLFFVDYIAIMGLFVCGGYYLAKALRHIRKRKDMK